MIRGHFFQEQFKNRFKIVSVALFENLLKGGASMADKVYYIFRPFMTLRDGRIIYASQYGKKAFRIPVSNPKD